MRELKRNRQIEEIQEFMSKTLINGSFELLQAYTDKGYKFLMKVGNNKLTIISNKEHFDSHSVELMFEWIKQSIEGHWKTMHMEWIENKNTVNKHYCIESVEYIDREG
jgi:hypothetical protein